MSFKELLRRKKCLELQMCKRLNMLFTYIRVHNIQTKGSTRSQSRTSTSNVANICPSV